MPMASAARTIYKPTSVRIPKGLSIRRQDEALETVVLKTTQMKLLSSQAQTEVVELILERDTRLTLTPEGEATETFYILSGKLSCMLPSGPYLIEKDDCIVAQSLTEPTILTALSDVCLIYITTKPQFHTVSKHFQQLRQLAIDIEVKDGYTADHCERLLELSFATGRELGLSASQLHRLEFGAYFHDVGKIHIPLSILNKPAKLEPSEWEVIKKHPIFGRELLDNTFIKEAGVIVEQHHERIDGSGYPYGLSGDEVLIEASIVAVADTYDAMTTDRPYRQALPQEVALEEIRKYIGIHYSKEVVRAFVSALNLIEPKHRI
jgi:HD-GYP domain-containing protein (c-di-GMP phosphodiesterase class II)